LRSATVIVIFPVLRRTTNDDQLMLQGAGFWRQWSGV